MLRTLLPRHTTPRSRAESRSDLLVSFDYDLLVIGSGQKAAFQGAKLGKRVALVERTHMIGGVCVNTGTIPSKTLREAVVYLTGLSQREIYGSSYRVKADITMADLEERKLRVISRETDVIRDQLQRNHITLVAGTARFVDTTRSGSPETAAQKTTSPLTRL